MWLGSVALAARESPFEATGTMLVATLLALALLEHLFLALPVKDKVLWQWALDESAGLQEAGESPSNSDEEPARVVSV